MSALAASRPAPDDARGMMQRAALRDPWGDKAHTALAAFMLALLPLGTAPLAIMTGVVVGYSLLRLWATAPAVGYLIRLPVVWVLLALLAWTLASLAWSPDAAQGLDEAAILRLQIPMLIALWPVIGRWRALAWAVAVGAAAAAVSQVGQWALGDAWPMFLWWHAEIIPGRYPGLVHPNLTAFVQVEAVWLLVLARPASVRARLAAAALITAAIIGLALTGSRGAWIAMLCAAAAALPIIVRAWGAAPRRVRAVVLVALAPVVVGAIVLGPAVVSRVRSAEHDLQGALEQGDYSGDVAARWRQLGFSLHMVERHPLTGVGAGGYLHQAKDIVAHEPPHGDPAHRTTGLLTHPHSSLLYHAAVLGLPGLALYLLLWLALGRDMWNDSTPGRRWAWAPLWVAFFVAFALDSHNLSAPGTILLIFVIAVAAYESRPPSRWIAAEAHPPSPNNARVDRAGAASQVE